LTDQGVDYISKIIRKNRELKLLHLNLSYNKVQNRGIIVIAKALRKNKTLEELALRLWGNEITCPGV